MKSMVVLFSVYVALLAACGVPSDSEDQRTFTAAVEDGDANIENQKDDPRSGTPPGETGNATYKAAVLSISALGQIEGWALNTSNTAQALYVFFYVDGDATTGKELGQAKANLAGYDGNNPGEHRFSFQIPSQFRDGVEHIFAAYIEIPAGQELVEEAPANFTAYEPTQAGRDYYQNTLQPALQSNCSGCHTADEIAFDNHYPLLLSPSPAEGGTSTTNRIYQKAAGQLNHGGGDRCGGGGEPCASIVEWWKAEFMN